MAIPLGIGQLSESEVQISGTTTLLSLSGFCLANPVSPNRQPGLLRVVGRGSWPKCGTRRAPRCAQRVKLRTGATTSQPDVVWQEGTGHLLPQTSFRTQSLVSVVGSCLGEKTMHSRMMDNSHDYDI